MKNLLATLIGMLFAVSLTCDSFAQDAKEPPPKTATASSESARNDSKGEVEVALEELKTKGESVVTIHGEKSDNAKDKITGGVINGRAIELVQPAYPAIARAAHASGEVIVRVLIDKEGKVMAAQIVEGHPLLQAASINAARATRFTPTLVEGKPVNVLGQIVYNFMAK